MQIEIVPTAEEFARRAASVVCAAVGKRPDGTLGLPSGETPRGLYAVLARRVAEGDAVFDGVTAFAIDELQGLRRDHPATNASYFRERLKLPLRAFHTLDCETSDPETECSRFHRLIEEAGGLDLVVLGIGVNGHVAFNEPGTSFSSRARRVALSETTRTAYSNQFASESAVPAFALTLGIADLLEARRVLLLARGAAKARAVSGALTAAPDEALPASALQRHPEVTVLLDEEAASEMPR